MGQTSVGIGNWGKGSVSSPWQDIKVEADGSVCSVGGPFDHDIELSNA